MTKRDLVVVSTRHHLARLLKYYPRRPCVPSFVKSRILRPLQRHFLVLQQMYFILVCIHVGNPRVPPWILASGQNPAGAIMIIQGRSQGGGSWGARDPPPPPRFVSHVLSEQPTTGGKNDIKIW